MSDNLNQRPWQAQQAAQRLCVALGLSRDLHIDMLVRIISDSYSRIMDQLRSMQEERQSLRNILECQTDDIENPLSPIEAAKKLVIERDTLYSQRNWVQDELERIDDALQDQPSTGCLSEIVASREIMRKVQAKECEELRSELATIDGVLARQDALDAAPTRCDKILKCISTAKQVDALIGERDRLCEQLVEIRKVADAHSSLAKAVASERLAHTRSDQESYAIIKTLRAQLDEAIANQKRNDATDISSNQPSAVDDLKRALEAEKKVSEARRIVAENWERQLDESSKECVRTHLRNVGLIEEVNRWRTEVNQYIAEAAQQEGKIAQLRTRLREHDEQQFPDVRTATDMAINSPSLDPPTYAGEVDYLIGVQRQAMGYDASWQDWSTAGKDQWRQGVRAVRDSILVTYSGEIKQKAFAAGAESQNEILAQEIRNRDYYRGLVIKALEYLGPEKYVSDDGTVNDNPLRAKLPDLVRALAEKVKQCGKSSQPLTVGEERRLSDLHVTDRQRNLICELIASRIKPCDHTTEYLSRVEFDQELSKWLAAHSGAESTSTNSAYAAARQCCARRISRAGGST